MISTCYQYQVKNISLTPFCSFRRLSRANGSLVFGIDLVNLVLSQLHFFKRDLLRNKSTSSDLCLKSHIEKMILAKIILFGYVDKETLVYMCIGGLIH